MNFLEKARIRMEHWIHHNDHHLEEYEEFSRELEGAGKAECAQHVREMISLAARSNECLRKALDSLDKP